MNVLRLPHRISALPGDSNFVPSTLLLDFALLIFQFLYTINPLTQRVLLDSPQ